MIDFKQMRIFLRAALAPLAAILVACGGAGGSGPDTAAPPQTSGTPPLQSNPTPTPPPPGSSTPPVASTLPGAAAQVAAGDAHTCAVTNAGDVFCWGHNDAGQVGIAFDISRPFIEANRDVHEVPTRVAGLADHGIKIATTAGALVAGRAHTCAIARDSGAVHCWGASGRGQLGRGTFVDSGDASVPVSGLPGPAKQLAATDDGTCAIVSVGQASQTWCWGLRVTDSGNDPQLQSQDLLIARPYATAQHEDIDPAIRSVDGAAAIAGGGLHYCTDDGTTVRCWGSDIARQLGDASSTGQPLLPARPSELAVVPALDVQLFPSHLFLGLGGKFSCAIERQAADDSSGPVRCWGSNFHGELGVVGGVLETEVPQPVQFASSLAGTLVPAGDLQATALTAGQDHACAIDTNARVRCWGRNQFLQLGLAPAEAADVTRAVQLGVHAVPSGLETTDVVALAAGNDHSCAITTAGGIACWGRNDFAQLGRTAGDPLTAGAVPGFPVQP